jgi:hypothetical protein
MRSNAAVQSNTEPSRQAVINDHQRPEAVWVHYKKSTGEVSLTVVADGKSHVFYLNRRQVFGTTAQMYEALKDMEPHSPPGFP